MEKNLLIITILLSVILLIFGCTAQTKLADYQPKSAEEKEVLNFMKECEAAYQDKNLTKYLAFFHDNATIRGSSSTAGRHAQPIYTKRQYEDRAYA
jgi:hypothetical protein